MPTKKHHVEVEGRELTISNVEKVFRFPNVADARKLMDGDFVLDGEIVALDEQGRPSFQLLQNGRAHPLSVYLYVFDLLIRDGEALHTQTIERRRERLSELLPESIDPIRLSPLLQAPVDQVLEGAKAAAGRYYRQAQRFEIRSR
jgi:bifunctional non-homologous end joining protein LigD